MSVFFCDKREIEDEIHFVVSKEFTNNDAIDKFIFLMKLNGKQIRNFANYLVSIWEFRKSILYTNN